jgi:quercetin 2,3-dioxygenase
MTARRIDRIESGLRMGRTPTSDDSTMLIAPGDPGRTDPFLVMGEEKLSSPGFDWHPHRGMETMTLILDGVLEHGDSQGNAGLLQPGDVQWMTAGHGVIHRELAARDEYAHIVQLWVNLPSAQKLVPARYQDISPEALHPEPGVAVRLISERAENRWPILGLVLTLEPGVTYQQVLAADERAFAHVLSGRVLVAGREVRSGQVAWTDPLSAGGPTTLEFRTPQQDRPATVMLFAGRPIGEPVVAGGPFVMNSQAEIDQAHRDFRAGRLGRVPRRMRIR